MGLRLETLRVFRNSGGENKFAFELPLELGEVLFFGDRSENRVSGDGAVGAGGPGFGVSYQGKRARGKDLDGSALVGPASAKRSPRFEMDIGELPLVQSLGGPFG